jgi:hypothetical protein
LDETIIFFKENIVLGQHNDIKFSLDILGLEMAHMLRKVKYILIKFILWGLLTLEFLPLNNLYLIYSSHILQLGKKFIFDLFMKHFTIWYK